MLVFLFVENGKGGERKKASYLGCVRHPRKAKKEKENSRGEVLSSSSVGDNGVITWVFEENSFIPTAKLKNNKKFSILADHLGTPTSMYNEEGETVWERSLNTFGGVKEGNHGACPFIYQGQYYDKEIELAYNRFRYYDPEDGRYISVDPIGLMSGEFGFYNYVNNPNGWLDVFVLSKIYRRMKKDKDGNFIDSPLEGSPNSSQKGARTKKSNKDYNDFEEIMSPNDMVGPDHTGQKGLSASIVDGGNGGAVDTDNLPSGLSSVNDHGDHVSIYPSENMTFGEYQQKLNSIPWQ